jgi:hypothetical protein
MSKMRECPECGASVGKENLERHARKVHGRRGGDVEANRRERAVSKGADAIERRRRADRRRGAVVLAGIVLAALVLGGVFWMASSADWGEKPEGPPSTATCVEHAGLGIHWHAVLRITIGGVERKVPANIGIQAGCMAPLHTHAEDGVIHIEYSRPVSFHLGQFFDLWGMPFDEDSLLGHEGPVSMTVNGKPSKLYRSQPLADGMQIVLGA